MKRLRPSAAPCAASWRTQPDLPPYVVFSDRSLTEMATYFPQSEGSFLAIHGVGRHKLAQYGERFLAAIRRDCASTDSRNGPRWPRR